jgi:spore photoproduct lyase
MFTHIYVEADIAKHPRARQICARFPAATRVECRRYGEIFNSRSQNFRLQKQAPALILAGKHGRPVLEVPAGYGIGSNRNFYFSHMLNCLYDCRYCFLQGMYRSAHYVLFVNYETFAQEIDRIIAENAGKPVWFFSGYDCDSLALEPVSGFTAHFLPFFAARPDAFLELRTKSTQTRGLLRHAPLTNAVIAFSFTPREIHAALEHRVPSIDRRLGAMLRLQQAGWLLGLRFDPLIYQQDYRNAYQALFKTIFRRLDVDSLHSVSLGAFRLPRSYFRNIVRLYPDEPLFAGPLAVSRGMIAYRDELENEMIEFCTRELLEHIPRELLFPCQTAA